jgi:hypothetical protein
MERWVAAARTGEPVDDLIPVTTADGASAIEPTPAQAEELDRRLRFLHERFLVD